MQRLTLDGRLGISVEIDLCQRCRAFWFDPFETVHLTPASTLKLFALIADQATAAATSPFPAVCHCPTCQTRLLLTHDRQRNTPFQYWRCDLGHGRFTPFIDFLREKDFIRPLSREQVAEVRRNIQIVRCSNCGAPIDLVKTSACAHCGAPISMLDIKKMSELAAELDKTSRLYGATRPSPAAGLVHEDGELAALFASHASNRTSGGDSSSFSLVELGLQAAAQWLRKLVD